MRALGTRTRVYVNAPSPEAEFYDFCLSVCLSVYVSLSGPGVTGCIVLCLSVCLDVSVYVCLYIDVESPEAEFYDFCLCLSVYVSVSCEDLELLDA